MHLLHLIGAHHGEPQFGSPVSPKTPEAMALNYIDNLDARMEMFAAGYLVAKPIADRIFDRVRPLPGNLVKPLEKFQTHELKRPAAVAENERETQPIALGRSRPRPRDERRRRSAVTHRAAERSIHLFAFAPHLVKPLEKFRRRIRAAHRL